MSSLDAGISQRTAPLFPGEGAVGIEVDFIVRRDTFERVTDYPVDVMYLE